MLIEGRPDLVRPPRYRWQSHEGAGEYEVIMGLLGEGLPDIHAQLRVGKYLIDGACHPVAYEVWSDSKIPHKERRQRQRIADLVGAGWTVCYLHTHRPGFLDGQIFPSLAALHRLAERGEAPQYVYVRHRQFTSGSVVGGELVMQLWEQGEWAGIEAHQAQAEWERKDLKRRDALRRRYWLKHHGTEPPPRGQRKHRK